MQPYTFSPQSIASICSNNLVGSMSSLLSQMGCKIPVVYMQPFITVLINSESPEKKTKPINSLPVAIGWLSISFYQWLQDNYREPT